jgi:hypothetical protein
LNAHTFPQILHEVNHASYHGFYVSKKTKGFREVESHNLFVTTIIVFTYLKKKNNKNFINVLIFFKNFQTKVKTILYCKGIHNVGDLVCRYCFFLVSKSITELMLTLASNFLYNALLKGYEA